MYEKQVQAVWAEFAREEYDEGFMIENEIREMLEVIRGKDQEISTEFVKGFLVQYSSRANKDKIRY
eukprot:CAMPEP_0116878018 /NCGR_PEP_ID=MMETSP0463-20121206/9770_1 /TAXON_ID=181622 /ORGANISM="Strombidinopsis sp, Strain SopsisLIS2011" /LENGTH=65 /DNA_ID=CAMNT_0004525823 /DNA_START=174 /DNA_END=371 /DNA_ORIENTATION=+